MRGRGEVKPEIRKELLRVNATLLEASGSKKAPLPLSEIETIVANVCKFAPGNPALFAPSNQWPHRVPRPVVRIEHRPSRLRKSP
jgi:hypothetical protein